MCKRFYFRRLVLAIPLFFLFFTPSRGGQAPFRIPLLKDFVTSDSVSAFSRIKDGSEVIHTIDLNGAWKFKATDETRWIDAIIPGTVQEDLLRSGRLKNPYYRDNELDAQWVENKEWEYERNFTVEKVFLLRDKILLDCKGLDVICELYLNNIPVASTQNMFIEYEFDVKKYLHAGTNTIRVVFRSVLDWNKKQAEADPNVTWISGSSVTNDALKGLFYYSRKEASDFGWDWGIRLLSCGIWKTIRLVAFDKGRVAQLEVRQNLSNDREAILSVNAEVEIIGVSDKDFSLNFEIALHDSLVLSRKAQISHGVGDCFITIPNPQIWWPNGWGEHPLYTVKATLLHKGTKIHSRNVRIGLRTVEIVREKDRTGETFEIHVNGKHLFCKGANWIPADAMTGKLTEERWTGCPKNLL